MHHRYEDGSAWLVPDDYPLEKQQDWRVQGKDPFQ